MKTMYIHVCSQDTVILSILPWRVGQRAGRSRPKDTEPVFDYTHSTSLVFVKESLEARSGLNPAMSYDLCAPFHKKGSIQEKTKILQLPQIRARRWEAGALSLTTSSYSVVSESCKGFLMCLFYNSGTAHAKMVIFWIFAHNQLTRLILRMLSAENDIHMWSRSPQ